MNQLQRRRRQIKAYQQPELWVFQLMVLMLLSWNTHTHATEVIESVRFVPENEGMLAKTIDTLNAQTPFYCMGAEPFWSIELGEKTTVYIQSEELTLPLASVKPRFAEGVIHDYVRVYDTYNTNSRQPVMVMIHRNIHGCFTGMSNQKFDYDVTLVTSEFLRVGCCNAIKY